MRIRMTILALEAMTLACFPPRLCVAQTVAPTTPVAKAVAPSQFASASIGSGTAKIYAQTPLPWIAAVSPTGTGSAEVVVAPGAFTKYPLCQCTVSGGGAWFCYATPHGTFNLNGKPIGTWDNKIDVVTATNAPVNTTFTLSCTAQP